MAVAETILLAFIRVLLQKLASSDLVNVARYAGTLAKLLKWSDTLIQIQAVLVDAGHKQIRDRSVQVWLNNLQHLAYDMDDLLDDIATEVLRHRLNVGSDASSSSSSRKVLNIIPAGTSFTLHNFVYSYKTSSRLDNITTRLSDLAEQKGLLGLNGNVESSFVTSRQREQTSLVDVSKFVGREEDKVNLVMELFSNEPVDKNVDVVSIVGMGGIGKTTLANVLYSDNDVKSRFELRAWVCVSSDFNVFNVSKAIYKDVGGEDTDLENLNQLHEALRKKLSGKRFLVVLDDVWNESYDLWEIFQRPFGSGAPGSKILLTTRNTMVASVMDCVQPYHLKLLSNDEALSLFAQNALGELDFHSHPTLVEYGKGIIKKCDGLPLALMTLGRVLRGKADVSVWKELLNSEIWSLPNGREILPALRLSYYDLPSHLKQMFAYCSLFPKNYVFDKEEMVLLWMAEGFLNRSNGRKSMENLGRECFEELESRLFFRRSTNGKSHTMHDLINDLATDVAGEFFFRAIDGMWDEALQKFHHLSIIHQDRELYKKFKALHRASSLRTILALPASGEYFHSMNEVFVKLLPHLQFLRVLSLRRHLIKEVPQTIGSLKHVRYLNFSHSGITCLPEEVSKLYNLQSLLLRGCDKLSSLPKSFVKLINLRHLDNSDTPRLKKIPLGIGSLTSLQTLSKVINEETGGFKISELKGLSDLQGGLSMKQLHKVTNALHAHEAKLHEKNGLDDLEMEWSDDNYGSQNERTAYAVLDGLRPHVKLRKLKILFYNGTIFPSWVGDSSYDQLTDLTLRGCRSCTRLPALGHLRELRRLLVIGMSEMKTLDSGLLGPANSCQGIAFPSLEVLKFENMKSWEKWSTNGTVGSFPCLREISIRSCPKLAEVSVGRIPSLEVLDISRCSKAVLRNLVGGSSLIRSLTLSQIKGLAHLHGGVIEHLGAVEYLCIGSCQELKYLWELESEACRLLVKLRVLDISCCYNLLSLGMKDLSSVREVRLSSCSRLESYSCPNTVEQFTLSGCSSMKSLSFNHPSSLKFLSINYYTIHEDDPFYFDCFWPSPQSLAIVKLDNLESLSMVSFNNIAWFPSNCFKYLTRLTIINCEHIQFIPETSFGFDSLFCLSYLYISGCRKLTSFPHKHLPRLTSLKQMAIFNCRSMHSFPCRSWPPNLSTLTIGRLELPMSKWGSQDFPTSLVKLTLDGEDSRVVSFANEEDVMNTTSSSSFLLPGSLTSLDIYNFLDLESLSKGLQHLTCLEMLSISSCPKLRDLPETLLPLLSSLSVSSCRKLNIRRYQNDISEIPETHINIY